MAQIQPILHDEFAVCACKGKEYKARDAIDAALFRGDLKSIWKEFIRNVHSEKRAKELQLDLDLDAVEEMAELFRYEHDLITAEETERWLEQRGLTLDDFSNYFARRHWRATIEEDVPEQPADLVYATAELRELFTIELILAGELDLLIKRLTWRLAALVANRQNPVDPKKIARERKRFLDRIAIQSSKLGDWLGRIGRDEQWLEETLVMETIYRSNCETILNLQARTKQLTMLRMPLTRFEAEVIEVESLDAAKEALFCIRQDGMSMEEVAAEARYPYRRITFRHEDVPAEWQQKFWSVRAGDVLEPLSRGDGFELYRISQKSEPNLNDTIVQERIDQRLLERHFSELTRDHLEPRLDTAVSPQ